MDTSAVLSVGPQGRVCVWLEDLRADADLGCFPLLLSGAPRSKEETRRTAESLAAAAAAQISGRTAEVALVVSDRADPSLLLELGRALEVCGMILSAVAVRRTIARALVQSLADIEIGSTWLLDVQAQGFALVSLETDRVVPIPLNMAQLVENRRIAVVDAFRAEHRVDLKHLGGSPQRIDAWLEAKQRERAIGSAGTLQWELADGTVLSIRAAPLRNALESVHAAAILAIQNSALEVVGGESSALVIASSVDEWFQVGPTLRASLPGTLVRVLRREEEASLLVDWLRKQPARAPSAAWILEQDFAAPEAFSWSAPTERDRQPIEEAPRAAARPPRAPAPARTAAAALSPGAAAHPTYARWLAIGVIFLALLQLGCFLWLLGRVKDPEVLAADSVRAPQEGLSAVRDLLEHQDQSLAREVRQREELASRLDGIGATLQDLTEEDSRRAQELEELRGELATLASSREQSEADELATIENALAELDRRLAGLEQSGSSERQSIERLESSLADLRASSEAAEERSRALELSLADLLSRSSAPQEGSPLGAPSTDQEALLRLEERLRQNEDQVASLITAIEVATKSPEEVAARRFVARGGGGELALVAGVDSQNHGVLRLQNEHGARQVVLGTGGSAGTLSTFNSAGSELFSASHHTHGAGLLSVNNARGERRISISTNSDDDGVIWIRDRKGQILELLGGGADLAEAVRPSPGTVLVPGALVRAVGADEKGLLVQLSEGAYDTRVLGIVSSAGNLRPALTLNKLGVPGESAIALAGTVFCLADASQARIHPGDLLASSSRAGHAMRADPDCAPAGSIVGKALEGLDQGTGLIRVFVHR